MTDAPVTVGWVSSGLLAVRLVFVLECLVWICPAIFLVTHLENQWQVRQVNYYHRRRSLSIKK